MVDPKNFYLTLDGRKFHFRQINANDKELLQRGFSQVSERSKYLRFFAVHSKLSDYELKFFTEVDNINHIAWGILDESVNDSIPVGVARFVRIKDEPEIAEVAYLVIDSYQGIGLGHHLFAILNILAARVGLKKFRYFVLSENTKALNSGIYLDQLLKRAELDYRAVENLSKSPDDISKNVARQVEIEIKYEGYIKRQLREIEKFRNLEKVKIPKDFDFTKVHGLSNELKEKLSAITPTSLGQASRIDVITPAALSVLMIAIKAAHENQEPE